MEASVNQPYEPVHAPRNQYHEWTCVTMDELMFKPVPKKCPRPTRFGYSPPARNSTFIVFTTKTLSTKRFKQVRKQFLAEVHESVCHNLDPVVFRSVPLTQRSSRRIHVHVIYLFLKRGFIGLCIGYLSRAHFLRNMR